ncbi:MAG: sigma-70 family RNA polymerase sigma factor [Myxococcales bacterium]|nr:sigma-70 family RNA polymerase sigma factor [Myxococcales bacterium]
MSALPLAMEMPASSGTLPGDTMQRARLSKLMNEGFDAVWRLLRRLGLPPDAADDAAQEVFLVAARRIDRIAEGSERSFLYGTALRVAQAHRRKLGRDAKRHVPLDDAHAGESTTPERALGTRQELERLDRALSVLDHDERSVFVLFEIEELSLSEISSMLSIPRGTVASRLRRARTRFVRALRTTQRGSHV